MNMISETENIAADTIVCPKCGRRNAPTLLKCLYCGANLELSDEQSAKVQPRLRKIEAWEKAFNLIYVPAENKDFDEKNLPEISRMTRIEEDTLKRVFETGKSLPIARAESVKEVSIVKERLSEANIETIIISDEDLAFEQPPKRLRGLEFEDNYLSLKLFNINESIKIRCEDLTLIVAGAVFHKKIESVEKRKGKDEKKILDATETASDEMLIDIYSKDDKIGFRIEQKGFDFSCLGDDKTMLAAQNIKLLIEKLKMFAPNAKVSDDYLNVREFLGEIWEVEHRKDSQGLKRHGFGKFDFSNLTTSNNLNQFTKYSRLQTNLL